MQTDGREKRLVQAIKASPDFNSIKGNPTKVLAAIDEFSNQKDFLANIGSDKGRTVSNMIMSEKPLTLVECGGFVGYSAIFFADAMKKALTTASKAEDIHVWSIEVNQSFVDTARELVDIAGLSKNVTIVNGASGEALQRLHDEGHLKNIDLLFLDHVEALYKSDLDLAIQLGLIKAGALVIADNIIMPGAPEYKAYVNTDPKFESCGVSGLLMPGEIPVSISLFDVYGKKPC